MCSRFDSTHKVLFNLLFFFYFYDHGVICVLCFCLFVCFLFVCLFVCLFLLLLFVFVVFVFVVVLGEGRFFLIIFIIRF